MLELDQLWRCAHRVGLGRDGIGVLEEMSTTSACRLPGLVTVIFTLRRSAVGTPERKQRPVIGVRGVGDGGLHVDVEEGRAASLFAQSFVL